MAGTNEILMIVTICSALFTNQIAFVSTTPAISAIKLDIGIEALQNTLFWYNNVAISAFILVAAHLGDVAFGNKKMFACGMAWCSLSSFAAALSVHVPSLFLISRVT